MEKCQVTKIRTAYLSEYPVAFVLVVVVQLVTSGVNTVPRDDGLFVMTELVPLYWIGRLSSESVDSAPSSSIPSLGDLPGDLCMTGFVMVDFANKLA